MRKLNLDKRKIKRLQQQCLHHNVFPILLNQCLDGHPPAIYSLLKPLLNDAINQLESLNLNEIKNIVDLLPSGFRMLLQSFEQPITKEYLSRVAEYYIAVEVQKGYSPIDSVLKPEIKDSEVLEEFPELVDQFDDDGLLIINDNFIMLDGGIKYGDYLLHYHQFLRRVFAANPNFDFLGRLAQYRKCTNEYNTFRVAIDHRRIMKFDDYRQFIEMDTWFGPKFDQQKLDDRDYVGTTVVGRIYPNSLDSYPLIRTEFLWKVNEAEYIKTLEIEEISDPDRTYENWHINRYVHSERNIKEKVFQHFDGAVKVYPPHNYKGREDQTMPNNIKPEHYIKLFRIDGKIDLKNWISLVSMFYKGNEMVIEYFDPVLFNEKIRPMREITENALRE